LAAAGAFGVLARRLDHGERGPETPAVENRLGSSPTRETTDGDNPSGEVSTPGSLHRAVADAAG